MKYILKNAIILIFLINIINFDVHAIKNIDEKQLNENIDINNDIYVQHDNNSNNIYLLNSEGESTIVYKIINVTYTASKQWTKDGLYINDPSGKVSATSPNDYIPVKENEIYFVKLYGIGDIYKGESGNEWHITTPIVYFDDLGNCIGSALSGEFSNSKSGVEIVIPPGATKMYISNYNNQNISIQKKIILNEDEFNKIKNTQNQIFNYVESNYESVKSDPIIYSELDKAYITFVNDDSRSNVDKFADLFISKNIPLCFAAVADNLLNNASNLKETRLDVALKIQEAGGEILAHNAEVITTNTINDKNFMYNYFIVQKQLLTNMGLNVNGIILAGGSGQIVGSPITAKWASAIYKYSDLLGEKYDTKLGIDSVYYHYRSGLSNYNNDIEKIKKDIDKAIEENSWKVFYFHDTNEISLEVLDEVLDYINSKNSKDIEVVTYNTMYEKFATRESTVKNTKKTYYVSSDGTSKDGTDINDPINLQTLNNKKIKTGDTILFKSGDTFFGTLNLSIASVDNEYVTISNYGKGNLPTISTYKYISDKWKKYSENIYRIDIKDINNYTGYINDATSAFNVGFLEDDNGNKYYNKKTSLNLLQEQYDFYSDGIQYLYMYVDSNPYEILGNLKVIVRSNLMMLNSNMKISNIRFSYTGGHALEGSDKNEENIIISNCIIENIGGSYLYSSSLTNDTRYGNGIEFYGSNAKNITITNNIFRNIYDVAFTIQGSSGSGTDIYVYNNVFINNSQDSEIWESDFATGIYNYRFYDNLSINQGRGWGYKARPDKYPAASILFWGYEIDNTDIRFNNNIFYNPRQIYYLAVATDRYFLSHNTIKSDNNIYYMSDDTTIYRNNWNYTTRDEFIDRYKVDKNSKFNFINENIDLTKQANELNNINRIRLLVLDKKSVIKSIELEDNNIQLKKGEYIDLENINLKINYFDGLNEFIKLDPTMISDIDYEKVGNQTVTISYLGYTAQFNIEILDIPNTKIDLDNNLTIDKENNFDIINDNVDENISKTEEIKEENNLYTESNDCSVYDNNKLEEELNISIDKEEDIFKNYDLISDNNDKISQSYEDNEKNLKYMISIITTTVLMFIGINILKVKK